MQLSSGMCARHNGICIPVASRAWPLQPAESRRPVRQPVQRRHSCKHSRRTLATSAGQSEGGSTVTFLGAANQSMEVHCPQGSYILDAGLDAGLELPYTCRGGICGACVGRVVKGEVDQSDVEDLSFTLDEGDIEQGMALLCQSRPVGDVTIETQSDWGYSLGMGDWKGATGVIAGKKPDSLTPWDK